SQLAARSVPARPNPSRHKYPVPRSRPQPHGRLPNDPPQGPPKMLQEIMGHASITTTLDLYGHLYPGDMDRHADRLATAPDQADKTKVRPDGPDQGEDGKRPSL